MYLFVSKNNKSIYGYTKHKNIAIDFYNLNLHRFRLVELSKSEIKEGIILPAGGNITYYVLSDEDGNKYEVPLTEFEGNKVMSAYLNMYSMISYIRSEITDNNKYGLNKKYLNLITELTSDLKKKNHLDYINDSIKPGCNNINSLKLYQDLCSLNDEIT